MTRQRQQRRLVVAVSMWVIALAGGAGSGTAAAQSSPNSARIEGKVSDATGAVLPGVLVTIKSAALQAPQLDSTTDQDGRYRFATLPGGVYAVTFELSGFARVIRDNVTVDAGFVASLDATLKIGQVEESITVTGQSPTIDVRTTTVGANIKKEILDTVPTSRSYADVGKLAPGVRLSGVPDVGGSQTGGQRGNLVSYGSNAGGQTLMLDGVNTDGTSGYWDFGSIQEMIVRPAGNDPEIPTSGMAFQVIVKSGGNQFHGDGLLAWQGRQLQGDNIDDQLRSQGVSAGNPMDRYYDADLAIGGRIVRDRLWFFGSGRRKEYRQEVLGFAGGPGPDGVYFTADDDTGTTTDRESNLVSKFTGQLAAKHRLSWSDNYGVKKQDERNGNAFRPHEAAVDYSLPSHVYNGEWTYTPTNRSVVLASVGRSWYKSDGLPYSDLPSTFDTVTMRWGGATVNSVGTGDDAAPAGSWSQRWQYTANYTYFQPHWLGDHEFKVGGYFTREWYDRHQDLRAAGTGGAGQDYRLYYAAGVPIEVLLYNTPFLSENNVGYQSGYLRDAWRIGDRLTINLGLRFERYHVYLPEQSKVAGTFSQAASYPKMELYDWRAAAPRFGVSYALTADKRTVVKATYGRFNFALRPSDTNIVRNLNGNEYVATRYRWQDVDSNGRFDGGAELGDFIQTEGGSTLRAVYNPDVRQPKTDEVTAFLERELAAGISARVGYVYKKEADLFKLVNTARPYSVFNLPIAQVDPGPDGRAGTADDGGMVTYYDYSAAYQGPAFESNSGVNLPGYSNRFDNIEVGVDKRLSHRWQLMASFLATKKDAWIAGPPQTPNEEFFPKDQTWDRTFRTAGSVQGPWGILGSALFEYQSGTALARDVLFRTGLRQLSSVTLRMEPIGARRLPGVKLLSLRARKTFTVLNGHRLSAEFDLYNALNANEATAMSVRSGPTYNQITAILPPRVARLGVSYGF